MEMMIAAVEWMMVVLSGHYLHFKNVNVNSIICMTDGGSSWLNENQHTIDLDKEQTNSSAMTLLRQLN